MKIRIARRAAVVAACGAAVLATAPAQASSPSPSPDEYTTVDGTKTNADVDSVEELDEFIASSTPKTLTQDVGSGEITAAYTQPKSDGIHKISMRSPCGSGDLCTQANSPYAHHGFYGSGTKTGSWPGKVRWTTGKWTGKVRVGSTWTANWVGPNTTVVLSRMSTVTGAQIQ